MSEAFPEDYKFEYGALSEKDRRFLSALPYRVGLWISGSDSAGDGSAARELAALETIIASFAQDMCKSEFIQRLMNDTLARRAEWPSWGQEIEDVPQECEKAVDMLEGRLSPKELKWFSGYLMEIAQTVAQAYREEGAGGVPFLSRIGALFARSGSSAYGGANVSARERAALAELGRKLLLHEGK